MPYLYVIRSPRGLRKIGYSINVEQRMAGMRSNNCIHDRGEMICESADFYDPATVAGIEGHVHAILWNWRVKGEWFAVPLEMALDAIADAVSAHAAGRLRTRPTGVNQPGFHGTPA